MSGEQFLRAHGWRLGRNLWWHDRLPDQGHQFEVALLQQGQWSADAHAETRAALEREQSANKTEIAAQVVLQGYLNASEAECARLRAVVKAANERWSLRQDNWRESSGRALATEQRAHRATQRAWATTVLSEADGDVASFADWHDLEKLPADVLALVREHAGKPVGTCDRCGKTAPLVEQPLRMAGAADDESWQVCAWGCEPEEPALSPLPQHLMVCFDTAG